MTSLGVKRRPGLGGGLGGGLHTRGLSVFSNATRVVTARETADSVITALSPAAWYRNATGVTSAGGFASQWDDYSGNARHLVQATGTNQPAYAAGVFTFDGADNYMRATFTRSTGRTVYTVFKQATWTANDQIYGGATANSMAIYQDTTTPNISPFGGGAPDAALREGGLAVNTLGIVCVVFNAGSSSIRVNNAAKKTGTLSTTASGGITLGASNTPGSYSNIAVLEHVEFEAAHDDTTQSSVITALNNALTVF